jgi:hypothetical protein
MAKRITPSNINLNQIDFGGECSTSTCCKIKQFDFLLLLLPSKLLPFPEIADWTNFSIFNLVLFFL